MPVELKVIQDFYDRMLYLIQRGEKFPGTIASVVSHSDCTFLPLQLVGPLWGPRSPGGPSDGSRGRKAPESGHCETKPRRGVGTRTQAFRRLFEADFPRNCLPGAFWQPPATIRRLFEPCLIANKFAIRLSLSGRHSAIMRTDSATLR